MSRLRVARLDGVRAIAILFVIAFHHDFFAKSGWIGVDLFFVLSGYLITQILRRTKTEPTYWSRFYIKRAARILPPMLVTVLVCLALSKHIHPLTIAGYTLFLGDVMAVVRYNNGLLRPLWSLAVEEHFYLVWPIVILIFSRKRLLIVLAAVLVLEPILRAVCTPHFHTNDVIYYLTPFRLDGLAAGSLLALLTEKNEIPLSAKKWIGYAALTSVMVFFGLPHLFPAFNLDQNTVVFNSLGYSLVTLTCFLLIAWVLTLTSGITYGFLSSRPMAYLGRISYGMYLYHSPIRVTMWKLTHSKFGEEVDPTRAHLLFLPNLAIIIVVAAVSYRLMEQPIMHWGNKLVDNLGPNTDLVPAAQELA